MGMGQSLIAKEHVGWEIMGQSLENILHGAIFQTHQLYSHLSALH